METKTYQSPEVQVIACETASVLAASNWNDSSIPDNYNDIYVL